MLPFFNPIDNIPIPGPLKLVERAEQILNEWLVDNTDLVFEEQPEIDEARGLLNDAIEQLKQAGHIPT